MAGESARHSEILVRARQGHPQALSDLFAQHRERLRRMVQLRMDPRLQGRLDPSDVLQEAYLEFARSVPDFPHEPTTPFYLWLRHLTGMKMLALHRQHLGAKMRDARRELPLHGGAFPEASSASMAAELMGPGTTPSQAAVRAERQRRLQDALDTLDPTDREVLGLRHFEQLSNAEAAEVLGIQERAAGKRYLRALQRLKDILATLPGGLAALDP